MGYDVYGLSPKINTDVPSIITDFQKKEWSNTTEEEQKEYFAMQDVYREENPGEYFRANVWYWRPIWNFVCAACDDFLSDANIEAGYSNSGDKISKTKSKRIAARLRRLLKDGSVDKYEAQYAFNQMSAEDEKCELCKGTGKRTDMEVPSGCNGCSGKGTKRPWSCSYPFSKDNVIEFEKFCEQSGGFTIC